MDHATSSIEFHSVFCLIIALDVIVNSKLYSLHRNTKLLSLFSQDQDLSGAKTLTPFVVPFSIHHSANHKNFLVFFPDDLKI